LAESHYAEKSVHPKEMNVVVHNKNANGEYLTSRGSCVKALFEDNL
jgi:hypothetical protein